MNWQTIKVRFDELGCFIQFNRPEAKNTINDLLVEECLQVLNRCEMENIKVVIFEGSADIFCFGADFQGIHAHLAKGEQTGSNSENLYNLWLKMATGPFITISHVRGMANAGGMGFVAASDIVLSDASSSFSLSELLFGLFPACVLPFLVRKIGFQKAHYMALMTKPITVQQALSWGLVDAYLEKSDVLLKQHLLRLKWLPVDGLSKYKTYMNDINDILIKARDLAISSNMNMFSDSANLDRIFQFIDKGVFPWEA